MKNLNKHENGVALLFALGLLSLMSVLGVAFVANSLTAQKTAVNLGARNQAQIVLDSAVNRIMITLMALLRQDQTTTNFSVIYSTNDGSPRQTSGEVNATFDQLNGANSKLNMALTGLPRYEGEKSQATWVYVRDTSGRMIARMAYQVLPTGTSSLSLDRVLKGIYNPLTQALVEDADKNPMAWNQRIGKDISELYIGKASAFRQEWSVDNDSNDSLPATSATPIVSSFGEFFNTDIYKIIGNPTDTALDSQRRVWLRRWFSESEAAAPEAFYVTGSPETKMEEATAYHRFNLGPIEGTTVTDKWYSRINGFAEKGEEIKNSKNAVEHLRAEGLKFYPEDTENPPGSGIPYLRSMIGKDKGSFADINVRRDQIAANLNDYCDEDSIPTSDISAKDWSKDNIPTYTGNEKTPYINEFVLRLKLGNLTSSVNSIKFDVTPDFLTELIDIYGGATTDYNVKAWFNNLTYDFSVSAKIKVTFQDNSDETVDVDGTLPSPVEQTGEFISDTIKDADADAGAITAGGFKDGYWVVVNNFPDTNKRSLSFTITDADIQSKLDDQTKAIKEKKLESYKITVKKVSLGLNYVGLYDTKEPTETFGVDFVKCPSSAIEYSGDTATIELKSNNKPEDVETYKDWNVFYLSGIEVRDPRQNLNFKENQQVPSLKDKPSDWKCAPIVQARLAGDISNIGSIEIKKDEDTGKLRFSGKTNSCSNPSKPFAADDLYATGTIGVPGEDYDKEIVTDPAWKSADINGHLSTAFIRNAPMQSLWELGAIHRAAPWQTINIKAASITAASTTKRIELSDNQPDAAKDKEGYEYIDGDGILLDQVKLTNKAYSGGKLDVNMLRKPDTPDPDTPDPGYNTAWDKDMRRALLANVRYGQQLSDLEKLPDNPVDNTNGTLINWNNVPVDEETWAKPEGRTGNNAGKYVSRADFVQGAADPQVTITKFLANGFGLLTNYDDLPDAQQEELVGKTVNLLTAGATAPTTIQAVVVVQTIKGIALPVDKEGNTVPVVVVRPAVTKEGTPVTPQPQITKNSNDLVLASYNYNGEQEKRYVYSDEITSETRALVTIKKVQDAHGIRLQLQNIQYY